MSEVPGDAGFLKLRLFLEGIEVPVISATVNIGIGAPASCVLQIIPTDKAMNFLPRTTVHLFYYDFEGDLVGDYAQTDEGTEDELFERYKLFFSGEMVTAQETQNAAGQRSVVLQCLDFSVYWDTAYQYMLTFGPNGTGILGSPAKFLGANDYLFDDIINDPVSVVSGLISRGKPKSKGLVDEDPVTGEDSRGLMGGLVSVLETMGGIWYSSDSTLRVRGINDFFTLAELRLKLLQQIGAETKDTTARSIFSGKVFNQWLNNSLGAGGTLFSYRDILRIIFNYIYYDVVPNPVAYFKPSDLKTTTTKKPYTYKVGLRGDGRDVNLKSSLDELIKEVESVLGGVGVLPTTFMGEEVTTEMAQDLTTQTGGLTSLGATVGVLQWSQNLPSGASLSGMCSALAGEATYLAENGSSSTAGHYSSAAASLEIAQGAADLLTGASVIEDSLSNVLDYLTDAREAVESAMGATATGTRDSLSSTGTYSKLYTQIFRPDIWMCAPPRSNVWFPELYTQFNYQRNYLREVTRLQLTTSMEIVGSDPLLDYYYYAPKVESFRGIAVNDTTKEARKNFLLMDHEVFSGIVPKFSHMCESGFFANRALRKLLVSKDKSMKQVFADRAANYEFFKFRYAPRSMQISGKFSPEKICGVPGLVIRKGLMLPEGFDVSGVLDLINAGAKEILLGFGDDATGQRITLPAQYVGMVSTLTHSVHQGGGSTNATLTYARQHRTATGEDDEFLDIQREQVPTRYFTTTYEAQSLWNNKDTKRLEELKNLTPQDGNPDTPAVTQIGMTGPLGGTIEDIQTPDGTSFFRVSSLSDGIVVEESSLSVDTLLWPSCKVIERIDGNVGNTKVAEVTVEKPFEEIIRPNWYAPIYANTYTEGADEKGIGPEFYAPLFGTGSIVDGLQSSVGNLTQTQVVSQQFSAQDNSESYTLDAENLAEALAEVKAYAVTAESAISIQKAADYLATLYGLVKSRGQDVQKFVYGYVKRPVASMRDILGTADLLIDKESGAVTQGTEGFHSRAFGPYENCEILSQSSVEGITDLFSATGQYQRINGTISRGVDLTADPRLRRWERVNAYAEELGFSRGLRG